MTLGLDIFMKYRQWLESAEMLTQRTLSMSGTFYHVTNQQNAQKILQSGFSFNNIGKGFGYVDLGEPVGLSLFLKKDDANEFLKSNVLLAVKVSQVKTLDARNIDNGSWVKHDGGWGEFISHFFNIEGEDVFDRDFVTNLLRKNGFNAVLHSGELRLLDLKHITSVNNA